MKRKSVIEMKTVGYWSVLGGVEVKDVEYGIDDYILCVVNAWYGKKSAHCVKVNTTSAGRLYIRLFGYRLYLDECLRVD